MNAFPLILIVIIILSVVMIAVKKGKKSTPVTVKEKPLNPFDVIQINSRGVQLLESLQIIETTTNIETLRSRINFLFEIYPSLVVLGTFKHRYVAEAEKAMKTYQERYHDRTITESQAALLLNPNLDTLKQHMSNCVVLSYAAFVKQKIVEIETLKSNKAINNRGDIIIKTGNEIKLLYETFELPNQNHIDAIDKITYNTDFFLFEKTTTLESDKEYRRLTLHILLVKLYEFSNCDNLFNVEKMAHEIFDLTNEALAFRDDSSYNSYAKWAIKEYNKNHDEKATEYQVEYVKNLSPFNEENEIKRKFEEIVTNYKPYWDNVISGYVRKNAEINRRKYLIEKTEQMVTECEKHGFTHLVTILKDYHTEQVNFLQNSTSK